MSRAFIVSAVGQAAQKAQAYRLLYRINRLFVDTIRATGGGNADRFLVVQGYWTDIYNTVDPLFQFSTDTVDYRLILSIHYYTPGISPAPTAPEPRGNPRPKGPSLIVCSTCYGPVSWTRASR